MPNSNLFRSDEEYYRTLFHELVHSTGHASRLNRTELLKINMLKSHDYSKEELVAEMGSAFLCGRCGILWIIKMIIKLCFSLSFGSSSYAPG
jgi:antirestriction protein ArdC